MSGTLPQAKTNQRNAPEILLELDFFNSTVTHTSSNRGAQIDGKPLVNPSNAEVSQLVSEIVPKWNRRSSSY